MISLTSGPGSTPVKLSTERILTTHTGSLPRPAALVELLNSRERGEEVDSQFLDEHVREAVDLVLRRQAESGVDVVNDGEQSKNDYSRYIRQRLTGFDGETDEPVPHYTQRDFPDYARVYYNRARVKRPCAPAPSSGRTAHPCSRTSRTSTRRWDQLRTRRSLCRRPRPGSSRVRSRTGTSTTTRPTSTPWPT